jgi:hypothetical protein
LIQASLDKKQDPISKTTNTQKKVGGVAQVQRSEFKPHTNILCFK